FFLSATAARLSIALSRRDALPISLHPTALVIDGDQQGARPAGAYVAAQRGQLPAVTEVACEEDNAAHQWMAQPRALCGGQAQAGDRKSTRLNSSHVKSSYAVFC